MLYRILTERKNKPEVVEIVSAFFRGFNVMEGDGYWQGQPETSLIIEIETDEMEKVNATARAIKVFNQQRAVMVQEVVNRTWVV